MEKYIFIIKKSGEKCAISSKHNIPQHQKEETEMSIINKVIQKNKTKVNTQSSKWGACITKQKNKCTVHKKIVYMIRMRFYMLK